jgi:hypothetical protein
MIRLLFTFLKTQCSKCTRSSVMCSWRRSVKSSITRCNTSLMLALSSSKVTDRVSHTRLFTQTHKNSRGLRNQEILAANLNHETVRLDDAEIFRATSRYSFVQCVTWRHLAGTILSHVCSQPNSRVCYTYLRPWKCLHSSHCCRLLNVTVVDYSTSVFSAGLCTYKNHNNNVNSDMYVLYP